MRRREGSDGVAAEIWAFLEIAGGRLHETAPKMASEAVRTARLLGGRPCALIPAQDSSATVGDLGRFGLQRIYALSSGGRPLSSAEACAEAVAAVAARRAPVFLLFAATAFGSELGARVAARLGTGLVSACVDFMRKGEGLAARKALHGGKAHGTLEWCGSPPYVATIDLNVLEAVEHAGRSALEVVEEPVAVGPARVEHVRSWRMDPREVDLREARVVIGIGRPILALPGELGRIEGVAERVGAAVGASRPVTDGGLVSKDRQIGASGKWLTAEVYIACGISGSSYHLMGVKAVKHVVAINTDRNAPIFRLAELKVIGDMFQILPALERLLGRSDGNSA